MVKKKVTTARNKKENHKTILTATVVAFVTVGVILGIVGIVRNKYRNHHTEEYDGETYFIIDSDYDGIYSHQTTNVTYEKLAKIWSDPYDEKECREKIINSGSILSYEEYISLYEKLGLTKENFAKDNRNYAVFLRVSRASNAHQLRLADVETTKNSAVLYILNVEDEEQEEECDDETETEAETGIERLYTADLVVVPVEKSVKEIFTVSLMTKEDFEEMKTNKALKHQSAQDESSDASDVNPDEE